VEEIVHYFESHYYIAFMERHTKRSDYYCGITNDIGKNLSRHGISGYTACVECESLEVSSKVEAELRNLGFDIGSANNPEGNGGAKDSTVVYMAYKEDGFKR